MAHVFCCRDDVFIHETWRHDRAAGYNRMCCIEGPGPRAGVDGTAVSS